MADIEYFEDPAGYAQPREYSTDGSGGARVGTVVNWAGAVVSVGLVIGMGVWAWQLTMRDVSGVPVIRALEEPMRVAPDDPGGAQAPNQGLAVNRIAEGQEAGPVPDQLVLAPAPVELADLDLTVPETAEDSAASAATQTLIDRILSRDAEELAEVAPAAPAVADDTAASFVPASVPGVSRSLLPTPRPADLEIISASATTGTARAATQTTGGSDAVIVASAGPTELDPAGLAAGTRLVQLGAYDTADIARREWSLLADRFPDFFAGRARVIQQAGASDQPFYRLRAHGFEDLAASRRFCAALVAQGAACIPVTVR